jgi:hypothetical protein
VPELTEFEILNNTVYEWERIVNEQNIVSEFKRVIGGIILELTNFSGNPMNDLIISNDPKEQFAFVRSYGLTRIGFDLWEATSENVSDATNSRRRRSARRA